MKKIFFCFFRAKIRRKLFRNQEQKFQKVLYFSVHQVLVKHYQRKQLLLKLVSHFFIWLDQNLLKLLVVCKSKETNRAFSSIEFLQVLEQLVFEIYFAKHINDLHVLFISMKSMLLEKKDVESKNYTIKDFIVSFFYFRNKSSYMTSSEEEHTLNQCKIIN